MYKIYCLFLFTLLVTASNAQQKIKGIVRDNETNQPIPLTVITYQGKKFVCNSKGQFEITTVNGSFSITVTSSGYLSKDVVLKNKSDVSLIFLEPSNLLLNEIQVVGLSTQRKTINTPGSIGTITPRDFDRNNGIHLHNTLNLLPGVRMEMRTASGGTRIVMRGYGNQTNNNGVGYKAYLNDIPLTDADGSTTLDDVDFDNIGRVEVFKGPSSSVYGTGIAGVVTMYNQKAPEGRSVIQSVTGGSNNLLRTNTAIAIGTDKLNMYTNYGHQELQSFRQHSSSVKNFINMNADIYNDENRTFSIFASYTKSHDLLAGQVDSFNFIHHPDSADLDYIKNNAFIDIESARIGVAQEYKLSETFSNKTSVFIATQTIDNPTNNTLLKLNKYKFGARTSFVWTSRFGNKPVRISFGAEAFKNINYQKTYNQTNQVLGALTSDLEVKPLMWNQFARIELQIDDKTTVTAGASINYIEYAIKDMRAGTANYVNRSGFKPFKPTVMPRVVLAHKFTENNLTYISYADGYSPPNTNQVIITQLGKVNYDLRPEKGGNFEIGTKGNLFNKTFTYELSFFTVEIGDKLVSQNFAPNMAAGTPFYSITTNAGTIRNNGFEVFFNYAWQPKNDKSFVKLVRPFLTYSYYDCRNGSYKSDNNNNAFTRDYSGLKVSGVAPNLLNIGFDIETSAGLYLNATSMFTDRMPIVLDNSRYSPAYNLLNAKFGYRNSLAAGRDKKIVLDIFAGLDNILGHRYSQFTFINLTAPAGQLPKFFNPRTPYATYYIGANARFTL